jgi:hypothetical protein
VVSAGKLILVLKHGSTKVTENVTDVNTVG